MPARAGYSIKGPHAARVKGLRLRSISTIRFYDPSDTVLTAAFCLAAIYLSSSRARKSTYSYLTGFFFPHTRT